VEETNGESKAGNDTTLNLTSLVGVENDDSNDDHLDSGEHGEGRHHKALLNGLNIFGGGGGIHFHSLAVTRHFYFIRRN
jgi:hypothetical protein